MLQGFVNQCPPTKMCDFVLNAKKVIVNKNSVFSSRCGEMST